MKISRGIAPLGVVARIKLKLQEDKHFAELVKGSGIAFVLRIAGIFSGYVFALLVTRTLGAEAWGIFSLCLVVLQISSVIGRLGIDTALLRFTAEYVAKGKSGVLSNLHKRMLSLVLPVSSLMAGILFLGAPVLAQSVFHKPHLVHPLRIVSLAVVPLVLLWIHTEGLRGLKCIKDYMFLQQVGPFGLSVILFGLSLLVVKPGKITPLGVYLIAVFLVSGVAFFRWWQKISSFSPRRESSPAYREILDLSLPMMFSSSLAMIMSWTDILMLGALRSAGEVGIYNVTARLSMLTSLPLMAINTIAAPKFAEFWGRGDIKGLARVARQSTRLIFWFSAPVLVTFWVIPEVILRSFGKEFEGGATALRILTTGQFVNTAAGSVGWILQMTGNQKAYQNVLLLGTFFNIILNFWWIPSYGIAGAALASAITVIFWNLAFSVLVRERLGFWCFWIV